MWVSVNHSFLPRLWPGITPHGAESRQGQSSPIAFPCRFSVQLVQQTTVLNEPWIWHRPLGHLLACVTLSQGWAALDGGILSDLHRDCLCSCSWPSVNALSSKLCKYLRTSMRQWFNKEIKHESNSKLCHAESGPDSRLKSFSSIFGAFMIHLSLFLCSEIY